MNSPNNLMYKKSSSIRFGNKDLSYLQRKIAANVQDEIRKVCSTTEIDENDTVIIKIKLERATADNFRIFNDFVNNGFNFEYSNYILDMSSALFMDSTFLGCIVVFYKKVHKNGGEFKMVVDAEKVKILAPFEQLSKILHVFPSLDEALKSVL